MTQKPVKDVSDLDEIEGHYLRNVEAGEFKRALLCRMLAARSRAVALNDRAVAHLNAVHQHEETPEGRSVHAAKSEMLIDAASALVETLKPLEKAIEITQQGIMGLDENAARIALMALDLGLAVGQAAALDKGEMSKEMKARLSNRRYAVEARMMIERRRELERLRLAYDELVFRSDRPLSTGVIVAELSALFPNLSYSRLQQIIAAWHCN
jgi:hypothetical protein